MMCSTASQRSTLHGPCVTRFHGIFGIDHAHCFASEIWPPSATSWIDRCHPWPPSHIVDDIVKSGCHFVAIGHKLGRHDTNEWRISFSLAEQKLVYAMNHCQFLTYGLLKLFLKRIINNGLGDDDELLCSYHMKTAVFWAIQQSMIPHWCPHTLLYSSWVCFKLILKWVYEGVCPNFFIPSNNMFLSNIYGEAQNLLFIRLYELYKMGIKPMMDTLSIMSCTECLYYLRNSSLFLCGDEDFQSSEAVFDIILCKELKENDSLPALNYRADKKSCHILKLAAKFGCTSDMLYIAMYYYETYRYMEALFLIEVIKVKLSQPYVMHNFNVDEEMYTKVVGGQSWSRKMSQAVAWNIKPNNRIPYISELIPEQQCSKHNDVPILYVPPFVMLYILEVFCYIYVDTIRAKTALDNLRALVHFDQGQHIPAHTKNIAWYILGICQQMTGNFQDALYSYQQSLREDQLHSIQTATKMRIHEIHHRYHFTS
ncbi:uncharacterized protein LOC133197925 [Saccostrea echinata]|uniref:uncharacterized protein LOC133197925 n=1 Tax=Saccostrea echinata TaxID=191078 RepID=UPI002A7FCC1A|nr:uncharacterized protein LOC133197925 [Saccostrea echinata]